MSLREIASYLDALLRIADIEDYPNAFNGLQLENSGRVTRVAAAVDACEFTIRQAVRAGANLLVVHHGFLWTGAQPVQGALYRKLRHAIENDLAIYSAHLPLDAHEKFGNNALLCHAIGLTELEPFLAIGWKSARAFAIDDLLARVENAVGTAVRVARGGPDQTSMIGVVTGSAGSEVARAAADGVDTFITGEGPHWSFTAAEELGINLVYGGHYATETFGVKALTAHLAEAFGMKWDFLDHPTGL